MMVLILTSRDYYYFYNLPFWDKIECDSIKLFVAELSQRFLYLKEDPIKLFFSKEDMAKSFWCSHDSKDIKMLKRTIGNNVLIYVMPCIPSAYYCEGGDCLFPKEKHDYLGIVVNSVLEDCDNYFAKEVYVVVHDMDVFDDGKERHAMINDIDKTSKLGKLIFEDKLLVDNIYGYKHRSEPRRSVVYPLISEKLSQEDVPLNILQQFCEKMDYRKKMLNC